MSNVRELFTSKVYIASKTTFENLDAASRPYNIIYVTDYYGTQGGLFRSDGANWISMSGSVVLIGTSDQWVSGSFEGQLGIDATNTALYIWSGSEWVAVATDSSTETISNIVVDTLTDAPASAEIGTLLVTKNTNKIYWFDGSAWKALSEELINISEVNNVYGRFTKGLKLEGKTNQEMWSMLLTSHLTPSITAPSASITVKNNGSTVSNGALYEVGKTLDKFTATASYSDGGVGQTWGGKTEQSASIAGAATAYTFSGASIVAPDNALTTTATISSFEVVKGSQGSWNVKVDYSAGTHTPVDNDGTVYYGSYEANFDKETNTWKASSVTSSSVSIEGVYPIYAATSTAGVLTKQSLCKKPSPNSYVTFAMKADGGTSGTRWTFAVPSDWDIVAVQNEGGTPFGGTNASSIAQWSTSTKALNEIDTASTLETEYTVYVRDIATDAPGEQKIRVVLG